MCILENLDGRRVRLELERIRLFTSRARSTDTPDDRRLFNVFIRFSVYGRAALANEITTGDTLGPFRDINRPVDYVVVVVDRRGYAQYRKYQRQRSAAVGRRTRSDISPFGKRYSRRDLETVATRTEIGRKKRAPADRRILSLRGQRKRADAVGRIENTRTTVAYSRTDKRRPIWRVSLRDRGRNTDRYDQSP